MDDDHFLVRLRRQAEAVPLEENAILESDDPLSMRTDSFKQGFISSLTMIFLAEIADKTFFIAAIMAMRYNTAIVFTGAYSALVVMTLISCAMGYIVYWVPQQYVHYAAAVLFLVFAVQMLYEAYKLRGKSAQSEMEEVAAELRRDDEELRVRFRKDSKSEGDHGQADMVVEFMPTDADKARLRADTIRKNSVETSRVDSPSSSAHDQGETRSLQTPDPVVIEEDTNAVAEPEPEANQPILKRIEGFLSIFINAVFIKSFILTFVAEWGDRSQLSTVTLASATNKFAVFIGGCLGHFCCTLGAVIFGSIIAKKISLSILNFCGGLLFIGFSGYTFYLAITHEND